MHYLQDGAYDAKLIAAHYGLSRKGKPMVEFVWQIAGSDQTIKSFLHTENALGLRNAKGIALTQSWAPDWDGSDPAWFEQNPELCSRYEVKLTVVNVASPTDPNRIYSQVKWINPRNHFQRQAEAAAAKPALREFDAARLATLPEDLTPTMVGAWSAFAYLTEDWSPAAREAKWFDLIAKTAPGKDQIDFTEEDWQTILNHIKGE